MRRERRMLVAEVLIHHLDTLRMLLGPLQVTAAQLSRSSEQLIGEDGAVIQLRTGNGAGVAVFASFAAADVRYTSKCQNASDFERLPTGSAAIIQHPISLFRSATGLHTCASASSQVANSAPIQSAHE